MHSVCCGVCRRLVELCFQVGETRVKESKRKLTPPQVYNEIFFLILLPREFGRRCRNLDFAVMKASEFRNILLFLFPIVLDCIEPEYNNEKKVWLHLVFIIRACIIPNEEFRVVNDNDVLSACAKFYKLYEQCYGTQNCTYSIHVVISHILKIRGNRPLTYKSAFKFESFFIPGQPLPQNKY